MGLLMGCIGWVSYHHYSSMGLDWVTTNAVAVTIDRSIDQIERSVGQATQNTHSTTNHWKCSKLLSVAESHIHL